MVCKWNVFFLDSACLYEPNHQRDVQLQAVRVPAWQEGPVPEPVLSGAGPKPRRVLHLLSREQRGRRDALRLSHLIPHAFTYTHVQLMHHWPFIIESVRRNGEQDQCRGYQTGSDAWFVQILNWVNRYRSSEYMYRYRSQIFISQFQADEIWTINLCITLSKTLL